MNKFFYNSGLRKQASVNVRLLSGIGYILINKKLLSQYFVAHIYYLKTLQIFFSLLPVLKTYNLFITINGGGFKSQVDALILAISRLFFKMDPLKFSFLKNLGFLTHDLRVKERKKYGLLKARKASQYSKR